MADSRAVGQTLGLGRREYRGGRTFVLRLDLPNILNACLELSLRLTELRVRV